MEGKRKKRKKGEEVNTPCEAQGEARKEEGRVPVIPSIL